MPFVAPLPTLRAMTAVRDELSRELRPPLTAAEAVLEADRCLECGGPERPAPCVTGCPAGVDIPRFVAEIAAGDPAAAAATIFEDNILGGSCSRVCPVEVLCQRDCVLLHERRPPIEIGALQRYATDWAYAHDAALPRVEPNGWRVAVVGAGPAGLATAGELAARGYDVTVYDERREIGGLVRYAIAPYRQTIDPLPAEGRLLSDLGVRFVLGTRVDAARLRALRDESDAVVLAVGMGPDADVAYEGDELDGVWDSLPFIELLKTGAPPTVGSRVAVIGGGNTAVDVAVEAKRLGAEVSLLLYRRTEQEMPAYDHEVELARREGVDIRFLTSPVGFVGDRRVTGIRCAEMRLGAPDETGRRRPEPVPGREFVIPVDTAVKAIGQRPRDEFAELLRTVDTDGRTSDAKVFAAGDAVNGGASVVQAVAEAKRVVQTIERLRWDA
jgi:glutamate synthase (NADPH/NADH) small chain